MRFMYAVVALIIAILQGCASLPNDSGFVVTEKSAAAVRQEPWQNIAIRLDVFDRAGVGIAPIALPDPLPKEWENDFLDPARTYKVKAEGKEVVVPLQRVVFRAATYVGEAFQGLYDAVVNPGHDGFFTFIPLKEAEEAKKRSILVATSDGRSVMTTTGEMVPLPKGTTLEKLPEGFLQRHPSPMPPIMRVSTWEEDGQQFLTELMADFPKTIRVNEHRYAGPPHVESIAAKYTAVEQPLDILISCTNLRIHPGMTWISAVFYAWQAGRALTADDCLQKS